MSLGGRISAAEPAGSAAAKTVTHQIELADPVLPSSSPQSYTVLQRLDKNGFPIGYSLELSTPVCMDGKCKTVEATMQWNALGYYERIECSPDKPLTKKEHTPFAPEDYVKLDRILRDRHSILGRHSLAFMVKKSDEQAGQAPSTSVQEYSAEVDAWTGPTPVTVQQSVVQDAAYTSWAMWRWANGDIVPELRRLTEQRCSPAFLKRLLRSEDRRDVAFALDYISEHSPNDEQYVDAVFYALETGDREQVSRSLEFLCGAAKDQQLLHARLIEACGRMKQFCSPIVLDYFAAQPDLPTATLEELTEHLHRLPYFQVHLTLRLLEEREFFSKRTESDVSRLLESEDFFIARRACEFLMDQDLAAETRTKVAAFRERNRERL